MSSTHFTTDSVKPLLNIANGKGYIQLSLAYGFATMENGVKRSKAFRANTGIKIDPADWVSAKTDKSKLGEAWFTPQFISKSKKTYAIYHKQIEEQQTAILTAFNALVSEGEGVLPSPDQITKRLKGGEQKSQGAVRLVDYLSYYIANHTEGATSLKYITLRTMIEALEEVRKVKPFSEWAKGSGKIFLSTFSNEDYHDLTLLLQRATCVVPEVFKRYGPKAVTFAKHGTAYATSTLNKYQSDLCGVLKLAKKKHPVTYKFDDDRAPKVSDTKEFLTPPELGQWIHCVDAHGQPVTLNPGEDNARRLFALGALSGGCRFDDLENLLERRIYPYNGSELSIEVLAYSSRKTNTKTAIPLFHWNREIHRNPPTILTNQKLNEHLRTVARKLGLDRPQLIQTTRADGSTVEEERPLHEVLSSHAMRRTFISTMDLMLVSEILYTRVSGHAMSSGKRDAFRKYNSLTNEQAAELLLVACRARYHILPFQLFTDEVAIQLGIDQAKKEAA